MNNNDRSTRALGWYSIGLDVDGAFEVSAHLWDGKNWIGALGVPVEPGVSEIIESAATISGPLTLAKTTGITTEKISQQIYGAMNPLPTDEPRVSMGQVQEFLYQFIRFGFITERFDPAYNPNNVYQDFRNGWHRIETNEGTFCLRFCDGEWIDHDGYSFDPAEIAFNPDAGEVATFLHVLSEADKAQIERAAEDV